MLRGAKADAVAHGYLERALGDGCWHERDGLWILARVQGIPRASFERVLARFPLQWERRGVFEESFVRLFDRSRLSPHERTMLAELEALDAIPV
jgi:hypothetical protein